MPRSEPEYPDAKSVTSFADGVEYQDFIVEQLARRGLIVQVFASKRYQFDRGESFTGAEIKLDRRCTETGRLSIEVAEKARADVADWSPSGILRNDNAWLYMQGNHEIVFVFAKNWLRRFYWQRKPRVEEKRGTVRSFYLSLDDAKTYAAKWLDLRVEP